MKKFISLILSIAMLATLMPTMLVGAAGEDIITLPVTEDAPLTVENAYLGSNVDYGAYQGGNDEYAWLRTTKSTSCSYLVSKIALSGLAEQLGTDKVVSKVEFCTYLVGDYPGGGYAVNNSINFYSASAGWNESTITLNKWNEEKHSPAIVNKGNEYDEVDAVPDATIAYSFPAVSQGAAPVLATFDITAAFEKAMASGITPDSQFSFITAFSLGGYGYPLFALSEYNNSAYRPYIQITLGDIPQASVVAEALPSNPADDLKITLADNIASATASVNGQEVSSGITFSGKSFTLDYDFEPSEEYNVSVDITDATGKKLNKTYTFTTNDGTSLISTGKIYITEDVHLLSSVDNGKTSAFCANAYSDQGGLLYKASVGSINVPEDKEIAKVEFNFSCVTGDNRTSPCPLYIYNASTTWNEASVTVADFKNGTYLPLLKDTYNVEGDKGRFAYGDFENADVTSSVPLTSTLPTDESPLFVSVDITNVFKKAYSAGEVTGDGLLSFYMHTKGDGYDYFTVAMSEHSNEAARPYLTITYAPPISFEASDVLVVNNADNYDVAGFESAAGLDYVTKDNSIKAICKIINNESEPKSVVLAIAVYNDDKELVSVSFKTISATAQTQAVYATDAVTVANSTGFVKAFAWDAADNAPFGDNVEIPVQ